MILKVIVFGFVSNGKKSYILNPWNAMDFLIVLISLINLTVGQTANLGYLKVLRLIRVLRPLRMIARNPGLRIAI